MIASGNNGFTSALSFPACISAGVSVGAVSDEAWGTCSDRRPTATDMVACYSNSASFLSLLAPGSLIRSSGPGNSYFQSNGTSMAAPHVAGAWALLKQAKPDATVNEVLAVLQSTGKPVTDYRNRITKPRINIKSAIDQLTGGDKVLSYVRGGTGNGTVTLSLAGDRVSCADSCSKTYVKDAVVTLTAVASAGSTFSGWSDDCSGSTECTVTMSASRRVTAIFSSNTATTQLLTYRAQGTGKGNVSFSSVGTSDNCTADCVAEFSPDATVRLKATAQAGSVFRGWGEACKGKGSCVVKMSAARTVTAVFDSLPIMMITYEKKGSGSGKVFLSTSGGRTECTGSCQRSFGPRAKVTLSAEADPNSRFKGWSGACKGPRRCKLTLMGPANVTAEFEALPVHPLALTVGGSGTVTFSGNSGLSACTASCAHTVTGGTLVTMTAAPAPGFRFEGWGNDCGGRRSCKLRFNAAKTVSATFAPLRSAGSSRN